MGKGPLIFISAGEPSGDLHAAGLVAAMRERRPDARFLGIGGPRMEAAGVELLASYHQLAVVGLLEVISHAGPILRALRGAKRAISRERPALTILVDFPDFNFRLGDHSHSLGIPVFYYICPQLWAWRQGRVKRLARFAKALGVILPFEEEFYRSRGLEAHFVGHPLLDTLRPSTPPHLFRGELGLESGQRLVALLPGSRRGELQRHLPLMVEAASLMAGRDPSLRFVTALLHQEHAGLYRRLVPGGGGVEVPAVVGRTWDCLAAADLALAASGTVTLEAAILSTPMVVTYRVSRLTYLLGRRLIRVPFASLVNLLARREVVPELLQDRATPSAMASRALALLQSPEALARMEGELEEVRRMLGGPGASRRAAELALRCGGLL